MKKTLLTFLLLYCGLSAAAQDEPAAGDEAMSDLAIYAISLADTPYHYGGNSPDTGFDCSGFVRYVFEQTAGHTLPRTSQEMSKLGNSCSRINYSPATWCSSIRAASPTHTSASMWRRPLCASPKPGKAIAVVNMREQYWRKRYNGARRVTADWTASSVPFDSRASRNASAN